MKANVGVIGLGLLGSALAERLLASGFPIVVYNRTRSKADPLIELGARWSDNPLVECERVVISLYTSEIVAEVLHRLDDGLHAGQILVDTTTGLPEQSKTLARRLGEHGVHYLDAPVSGSSQQARRGEVTTIVGGPRDAYDACQDLFTCFSKEIYHVGACGSGSQMKLVSNLVLGLNRAALAEGLGLARAMGVEGETALKILAASAAYSQAMDTKGPKMIQGDYRPQAKLSQHLKDVRLILDEGNRHQAKLPLSNLHRRLLQQLEDEGLGELDNSAIYRAFG